MLGIWESAVIEGGVLQASHEVRGISLVDNTPGPTAAKRSGSQQAMFMTWSFAAHWEAEQGERSKKKKKKKALHFLLPFYMVVEEVDTYIARHHEYGQITCQVSNSFHATREAE